MHNFYRGIRRRKHAQPLIKTLALALKNRITSPVPDQMQRIKPARQRCWAPNQPGFFIPQIERFPRQIRDRIITPGRQAVFTAVAGPGAAGTHFRNQEAKLRIGDDVDPRVRRMLSRLPRAGAGTTSQVNDVFFAIRAETAQAIFHQ